MHPRSGAGRIKDDASTDEIVYEVKDADKTHSIKGADLDKLLRRAIRQGKEARYVVHFGKFGITAECHIRYEMLG